MTCWGRNEKSSVDYGMARDAPAEDGFVAIMLGTYTGTALKADGSIVSWGQSTTTVPDIVGYNPTTADFVALLGTSHGHACAVKTDGSIYCWGSYPTDAAA